MAVDGRRGAGAEAGTGPGPEPEPGERLRCGRFVADVWDAAVASEHPEADDPHLGTCPYCRAAVEQARQLREAARGLAEEDDAAAEGFAERVMGLLRAEVRLGRELPLGPAGSGLTIAESAAARVLRTAVEDRTGGAARAGSCRITPADGAATATDSSSAAAHGVPVVVAVRVSVRLDAPLAETAEQVRGAVLAAAEERLGLTVDAVDVAVDDILEEAGDE